jgi:DsbC/DsbD-like thiol-disulfide interchange protein/cytochrome c biogenesis protein CcdA
MRCHCGFASICALSLPLLTHAASTGVNPLQTDNVRAHLISEVANVAPSKPFWVALHLDIREEWHIYWRNPGDSGAAPTIDWELPPGFSVTAIQWPVPSRIRVGPLVNYGYANEAYLLVQVTPPPSLPALGPVALRANATWLVCHEECIPESASLELSLGVSNTESTLDRRWWKVVRKARDALPRRLPWPASVEVSTDTLRLQFATESLQSERIQDLWFYPNRYGIIEHAGDQKRTFNPRRLILTLPRGELKGRPLTRLDGLLVLTVSTDDGSLVRAFEVDVPARAALLQTVGDGFSLSYALMLALLGGLALNLMPCVFPVLSMKALNFVQLAQKVPSDVRRHGLAFLLGVLVSFTLLAGILLAMRFGGARIGWGFQLQSPQFVLLLAWLTFALGLMLSGVWSFGERLMGLGQPLTVGSGYAASFFTGALAVIVATPCTAPFMGTAVGFALSQSWPVAMAIFLVLGLGLSAPWVLLSFWPALLRFLPRPGPWMDRFKQLLAFPLYATAAWLVWVLAQQSANRGIASALAGMVIIAFVAWLHQSTRNSRHFWPKLGPLGIIVAAVALTGFARGVAPDQGNANESQSGVTASFGERFSKQRLEALRAAGDPVFVNFTAAWCITCLVNEKVVLGSERVRQALHRRGVTYLTGDWTTRDPEITEVLERFGRSGVPLYLLYPNGTGKAPEILPQILTENLVLRRLEQF